MCLHTQIIVYIYIERETESERERQRKRKRKRGRGGVCARSKRAIYIRMYILFIWVYFNPTLTIIFGHPLPPLCMAATEAGALFGRYDQNGDGSITFYEFLDHFNDVEKHKDGHSPEYY